MYTELFETLVFSGGWEGRRTGGGVFQWRSRLHPLTRCGVRKEHQLQEEEIGNCIDVIGAPLFQEHKTEAAA